MRLSIARLVAGAVRGVPGWFWVWTPAISPGPDYGFALTPPVLPH